MGDGRDGRDSRDVGLMGNMGLMGVVKEDATRYSKPNKPNKPIMPITSNQPKRSSSPFVEACDNHYAQMLLWVYANLFSIDYNWLIVEKKHKTEQIVGYLVFLPYLCKLFYNNIRKNQN